MSDLRELLSLVQDTSSFIRKRRSPLNHFSSPDNPVKSTIPIKKMEKYAPPKEKAPLIKKEKIAPPPIKRDPPSKKPIPVKSYKQNYGEIKALVEKSFPETPLVQTPLNDSLAKQIGNSWKEKTNKTVIGILSFSQNKRELHFQTHLARALSFMIAPTTLFRGERMEKENTWNLFFSSPHIKMIIAREEEIENAPHLQSCLKEIPSAGKSFLNDLPLYKIPPISLYLEDPMQKKHLWEHLKATLSSLKLS